jgi:hypothetical protein
MKRKAADDAHAEELGMRDMLTTIYNGLVTRPASPMEPHPPPGLFERVESIDDRLITVERNLAHRGFEGQMDPSGHVSGDITQNGVPEVKARTS